MVYKEINTNYLNEISDSPKFHIPIILRPFIFICPLSSAAVGDLNSSALEDDEIEPIDIDEEYMFSPTKIDCFVGSYEDRPMILPDYIPSY